MIAATGINAYFAYTVVGFRATGLIGYKQALAAVFIEVRLAYELRCLGCTHARLCRSSFCLQWRIVHFQRCNL